MAQSLRRLSQCIEENVPRTVQNVQTIWKLTWILWTKSITRLRSFISSILENQLLYQVDTFVMVRFEQLHLFTKHEQGRLESGTSITPQMEKHSLI